MALAVAVAAAEAQGHFDLDTAAVAPEKVSGYYIYRSTDNVDFLLLTTVSSLVHEFIDEEVDVSVENYYYKIEVKNSCDEDTKISSESSTILLNTKLIDGSVKLSWTAYEGWDTGVDYYIIEKMNKVGEWEIIKKINGDLLNYRVE